MPETATHKQCPRCNKIHPIAAATCDQCGRQFRTSFPSEQTQIVTSAPLPAVSAPLPIASGALTNLRLAGAPSYSEAQHFAIVDECSRQFVGLVWQYLLIFLFAPTIFLSVVMYFVILQTENNLRSKIASLGLDAETWAAPLRQARRQKLLIALAIAGTLILFGGMLVSIITYETNHTATSSSASQPNTDGSNVPNFGSENGNQ